MQEVSIKTHLIVTDVHEEYYMNWCGRIADTKPLFKNNMPIFIVIGSEGRLELNTTDMEYIEKCAKLMTKPHGRSSISSDDARIYILEENGHKTLLGILTHNHIKTYAQMYDKVGYIGN